VVILSPVTVRALVFMSLATSSRFVDEYILPPEMVAAFGGRDIAPVEISTCNDASSGVNLSPDDIIVHNMRINYGSKVSVAH
jgi:hypothetical protein